MAKPKIINFPNAAKIYGTDKDIVAEVIRITPTDATKWLECNRNNRPVRKRHVAFLANEIIEGNWQVNGQAIVIADDEQILDGQHRLFAIIESGKAIQSLVVYGITPEAFKTMDTGIHRTGADAMGLHFAELTKHTIDSVAVAVQWCSLIELNTLIRSSRLKLSNTDVIDYVKKHPSLIQCSDTLQGYPREQRPLTLGTLTALYEMFARKHESQATEFMRRLCTGEELKRDDIEFVLRAAFQRDSERKAKIAMNVRMHMVIKGWNWKRRGNDTGNKNVITIQPTEDRKIKIF